MSLLKRISNAVKLMACLLSLGAASAYAESPNIILILTDDQGWSQLSEPIDPAVPNASSDYLETPNMNRLANGGIRFTSGYSPAAICTPTRRGILFGTSSVRSGSEFRSRWEPLKHLSLPQALKRANPDYQCAHFGKWGELMGAAPEAVGYDASHGETGNGTGGMPNTLGFKRDTPGAPTHVIDNVDPKRTRTITDDAVAFMKRNLKEEKPFFVQLSYYAVHLSSVLRETTLTKYQQKGEPDRRYSQGWAGMLEDLDHDVGRLLDAVDELGIAENTYIFYLSDNGGRGSTPGGNDESKPTNFPLNGSKHQLYEGGIRVPFFVRGPGVPAGEYCHVPVAGYDLLPTFYDLAGGKELPSEEKDGVSIKRLLTNPAGGTLSRPDDALYFNFMLPKGGMSSIRSGDEKLMLFWDKNDQLKSRALYDLNADPLEQTDLSGKKPKRADALQKQLIDYMERVGGEMPTTALPRGPAEYKKYLKSQKQLQSRSTAEHSAQTTEPFTIAVLPDTQFYCDTRLKLSAKWGNGDLRRYFFAQTEWVRDNQERLNIAFLAHEGDLVQADAPEEWAIAKEAMSLLDGKVPYIMCLGNHDMGFEEADNKYGGNIGVNRDTHFNTYFPREKFAKRREFGGTFDPERHDNSWYHFEAAGMKFLIISLECKPRDEVLEWANQVVSEHPDHRVLVLTHAYLKPNKSRDTSGGVKAKGNSGEQTWEKFVSKHKNIFMVLCGHHTGEAVLTSTGDHGNEVHQVLCDYQNMNNGGESWLRYMTFKPESDTISVHTYNPALDQYNEGPKSRFDLHYPMEPSQASLKSSSKN